MLLAGGTGSIGVEGFGDDVGVKGTSDGVGTTRSQTTLQL